MDPEWEDVELDTPAPKRTTKENFSFSSSSSQEDIISGAVSWLVDNKTSIFTASSSSEEEKEKPNLKTSNKKNITALFRKDSIKESDKEESKRASHSEQRNSAPEPEVINESDTPENRLRITDCINRKEIDILEVLVQKGVDPNARAANGVPPLIHAVQTQNLPVVQILLCSSKLDINNTDITGQTALMAASKLNPMTIFEKNSVSVIKRLLLDKPGLDPNVQDAVGTTALQYAVAQKDVEFIQLLLKAGADVSLANQQGNTPLHTAAMLGDEEIVHLLCHSKSPLLLSKSKNSEGKMSTDLTTNANIKNYLQGKKTSVSNPIEVTWITHPKLPDRKGKLGIMMCLGKNSKAWARNLDQDFEQVMRQANPNVIVTLITNTELKEMNLGQLESEIVKRKIESFQCSTNKYLPASYSRFIEVIQIALKRLKQGKTVLIQCDDGFVRSGLGVAAILVMCGLTTSEAITFAQTLHPEIFQNPAHSVYLSNFAKKIVGIKLEDPDEEKAKDPPKKRSSKKSSSSKKIDVAFTI